MENCKAAANGKLHIFFFPLLDIQGLTTTPLLSTLSEVVGNVLPSSFPLFFLTKLRSVILCHHEINYSLIGQFRPIHNSILA